MEPGGARNWDGNVSADPAVEALVGDYLGRLHAAGWNLTPERREELVADVRDHIQEALRTEDAAARPEVAVRNVLERLGPPEEIVRAEGDESGTGPGEPGWGQRPVPGPGLVERYRDPVALFLLPFGSFLFIVGWFVGVALLWSSDVWRLRDKLLGTLVWPFGYLGVAFLGGIPVYTEACFSGGPVGGPPTTTSCTGGPPYPDWVGGVLLALALAAPVAVAVHLWLRRERVLRARQSVSGPAQDRGSSPSR